MSNPALDPEAAAKYCSCSRRFFDDTIAPHLRVINLAPPESRMRMPRYRVSDLDQYLEARAESPTRASRLSQAS